MSNLYTVEERAIKKVTQALYLGALRRGTSFRARKQFENVEPVFTILAILTVARKLQANKLQCLHAKDSRQLRWSP